MTLRTTSSWLPLSTVWDPANPLCSSEATTSEQGGKPGESPLSAEKQTTHSIGHHSTELRMARCRRQPLELFPDRNISLFLLPPHQLAFGILCQAKRQGQGVEGFTST